MKSDTVIYIHGKGGSTEEAAHYRALFPKADVFGIEYHADTPWVVCREIADEIKRLTDGKVILIANSIGAFYAMHSDIEKIVEKAYFISPIVDMEYLIESMINRKVLMKKLFDRKAKFLQPIVWNFLGNISHMSGTIRLFCAYQPRYYTGSLDHLTSYETIQDFQVKHNAGLTVMKGGEHWFHTKEQMEFLDRWIRNN